MRTFFLITLFTAAWIMAALGGWVGYMILDNESPYVWNAEESHIQPDPARQGAMVISDWKLDKINRICPGKVQRFYSDWDTGEVLAVSDTTEASNAVRMGDKRVRRNFEIPPGLPYKVGYQAEVAFACNLLQYIIPLRKMTPRILFHVEQQPDRAPLDR